ncbi:MAG TPA: alanine dehydrogenase [Dehalococcoidia bacterium]|nr:alanine dehydrogenase [Dehalococcoidia bacterium]
MVTLGVLKETKPAERRITLTPDDVRRLRETGATILVQAGAGVESGFPDEQFTAAGAGLAPTPEALFAAADVVIKVKEPTLPEIALLRPGQLYLSFLHLAAFPALIGPLRHCGATALGYETIAEDGQHPVLRPMSAVAGALALQIGEHYLEATSGGRGVLLPGIEGKHAGKVVVVGSGVVGEECGRLAYGEGVRVVFVDANPRRLDELRARYPRAGMLTPEAGRLADELADADLLVGGVYITGARAPHVVSRAQIARMPPRSVAVDVAIDQGGCFETSRPTSHADPIYVEEGVLHYCVTNIPSMVPRSASIALSHALTPYLEPVLRLGPERALQDSRALAEAVNISGGRILLDSLKELPASA